MPLPLLPAIVGAIGSAATGLINWGNAKANTDRTIKANKELAEYQYSKDLEMWNRGNEYNSPAAQMARLKEAGLNPNLVYGSGSAAGNMASNLPKYNAPTVSYNYEPPVSPLDMINQFQNFRIQQAQVDNLEAQRQATIQGTQVKELQSEFLGKSMFDRLREAANKGLFGTQKIEDMANRLGIGYELAQTQLGYAKGRNEMQRKQMMKLDIDTEMERKKLDLFMWKFWGDMGIRAFNSVLGAGVGGRAIQGMQSMNKNTREREAWKKEFIKNYEKY